VQVDESKNLFLQEVLSFASGLEELPPLGFKNQPILDLIKFKPFHDFIFHSIFKSICDMGHY